MTTNPSADSGKDILPANKLQGFGKLAHPGEGDITLNVDTQRTVGLAQRLLPFVNHRTSGKTLAAMVLKRFGTVAPGCRTNLGTATAKNTAFRVDEGSEILEVGAETLRGMFQRTDFTRQDTPNPWVSQNPEQPWSQGIVQGNTGIKPPFFPVELPVEVRLRVDEGDRYAHLSQFVGCGKAGRVRADDQDAIKTIFGVPHEVVPFCPAAFF
jgi:hypothetical protein